MSKATGSLRPDLQRMQVSLDDAPDKAVIVDKYGDAWQKSGYLGFWYRAFDGDGISSFQLAQNAEGAKFMQPKPGKQTKHLNIQGGER